MQAKTNKDRISGLIYSEPPKSDPKRYEIVKYATWRMRLYQELEAVTYEDLVKREIPSIDKMFPKLCQTAE